MIRFVRGVDRGLAKRSGRQSGTDRGSFIESERQAIYTRHVKW